MPTRSSDPDLLVDTSVAVLATRDRRAIETYRALGVELEILEP